MEVLESAAVGGDVNRPAGDDVAKVKRLLPAQERPRPRSIGDALRQAAQGRKPNKVALVAACTRKSSQAAKDTAGATGVYGQRPPSRPNSDDAV